MPSPHYKHLFGPVLSRRLGRSLGIDLIPFKVCTFDCVYCQLGRTTTQTIERKEWVPTAEVLTELKDWTTHDGHADVITLAGSGEPTLHTGFGDVLEAIHQLGPYRSILLTNGSLLHLPEVRSGATHADVVKVTLSASDAKIWNTIHRQAAGLHFTEMLEGLLAFREIYSGEIWLEVMLMGGLNALEDEVRRIDDIARSVRPERVQLNTTVRPPTESYARPVDKERLEQLAALFTPKAEVVGEAPKEAAPPASTIDEEAILGLLLRHPCTAADLSATFGIPEDRALEMLRHLQLSGRIKAQQTGSTTSYLVISEPAK